MCARATYFGRTMKRAAKILIVVTNADQYETAGYRTGLWLGELTHFYDVVTEAGAEVVLGSPAGGKIPIDPESLLFSGIGESMGIEGPVSKRYQSREFMRLLDDTAKLADLAPDDFDALYMTGGHGTMFDFPKSDALAKLTASMFEAGKIVAAVCHGPAGLLSATLASGEPLLRGKKVTGFSWAEEKLAKRAEVVPFNLEEELQKHGASYDKAILPFATYVVEDGRLITGQNPNSARGVAERVVAQLRAE